MNRSRRTRILVQSEEKLARDLAKEVRSRCDFQVIEDPSRALTMVEIRESARGNRFYLGEVLITECKIRIGSHIGIGVLQGHDEEKAQNLALIDAALAEDPGAWQHWEPRLEEADRQLQDLEGKKAGRVALTRVDFRTMDN